MEEPRMTPDASYGQMDGDTILKKRDHRGCWCGEKIKHSGLYILSLNCLYRQPGGDSGWIAIVDLRKTMTGDMNLGDFKVAPDMMTVDWMT